jgi:type I restriction enzyme S subunit
MSGMNNLPRDWTRTILAKVLEDCQAGFASGKKDVPDGLPHLRMNNIGVNGKLNLELLRTVPPSLAKEHHLLHKGDILVCTTNSAKLVGKSALFDLEGAYAFSNHLTRLRVDCKIVDRRFLQFQLFFLWQKGEFENLCKHWVNQSAIPKANLWALEILLPPFSEQRRIVAKLEKLLSRLEGCRARLDKIPTVLKRFRQSVLAAACSGRLTDDWREKHTQISSHGLTQNATDDLPSSWTWKPIQDLARASKGSIQSGPFGSNLLHSEFQSTGILAIGIDNVLDGEFSYGRQHRISPQKYKTLKKYTAHSLDVLVTVMATVGRCCVVPADIETAIMTKHVYRISCNQAMVSPHFLMHCIRGCPDAIAQVQGEIQGATRPGINGKILKEIKIPLPPLTEQQEIVRRVEALFKTADRIEERYRKAKTFIDKLTQSILAKAFRGELVPQESARKRQ